MTGPGEKLSSDDRGLHAVLVGFRPALRGYFARRTRSAAEADDLTQEVIARILKRAQSGPIDNVDGYIFQAAANLLREQGRQTTMRRAAPAINLGADLIGQDEEQTPERILLGRDACQRLVECLYELPERTRTVFVLNRFEDMRAPEIARRLGVSVSAVEKHMMRALAHLRAGLR
jgi:RNA polymerase sigma-70 factor (ECF subfamily)